MLIRNMVLIGATGRDTGKTVLACALIEQLRQQHTVVGVKITAVTPGKKSCPRGGEGCGVCDLLTGPYEITREIRTDGTKDTQRLLQAGADRVFWIKTLRTHMERSIQALLKRLDKNVVIICESTGLRTVVEPGLFLMTFHDAEKIRPSAQKVGHLADRVVCLHDGRLDMDVSGISFEQGRWRYPEQTENLDTTKDYARFLTGREG